MKECEYFSPEVLVKIGTYTITKHITMEIRLDDEKTFDWANVNFTVELLKQLKIQKGDRAYIYLGYDGELEEILVGDVFSIQNNKVHIRNDYIKLATRKVIQSFRKCTPQEVLSFMLSRSGVKEYKLSSNVYPIRELLSIGKLTVLEAIKYVEQKWQIKNSVYLFRGECFEWDMQHSQSKVYSFEYGVNILDLQNTCPKVWELTTISVPKIKVLDEININHMKISGTYKVHAINFYVNDYGFVRTKLTFKE